MNSPAQSGNGASASRHAWRAIAPIIVAVAIALLPAPAGLAQHAWYFFALFAGVIVGLVLEPLPGGAIGLIGVTVATVLAPFVLYTPGEMAKAGFKPANAALTWALSGFSNNGVADLWRVQVRSGLRKDRTGQTNCTAIGETDGAPDAHAGLSHCICGLAAGTVYAFQHGSQWGNHLPCHPPLAGTL